MRLHVLILAGGQSCRMGTDKANLKRPDGLTQLEYLITQAQALNYKSLLISSRQDHRIDQTLWVTDRYPNQGPIAGIDSAINRLASLYPDILSSPQSEKLLIIPCDMPYVTTEILQKLLGAPFSNTAYASYFPCILNITHELTNYLSDIMQNPEANRSVKGLHDKVSTRFIEHTDTEPLKSTNTPEDWRLFIKNFNTGNSAIDTTNHREE